MKQNTMIYTMNMTISQTSKVYHSSYYARHALFEKGSWLEQCEPEVLNIVNNNLSDDKPIKILDLGCGVGKNAIPISRILKQRATITCVDILPTAITTLKKNAQKFSVSSAITGIVSPIESYPIPTSSYDLILANSVLMFLDTRDAVKSVLEDMIHGTKNDGINYISLSCDVSERDMTTQKIEPNITELPFSFEETRTWLQTIYIGWKCILENGTPYSEHYVRDGKELLWTTTFLSVAYQKK